MAIKRSLTVALALLLGCAAATAACGSGSVSTSGVSTNAPTPAAARWWEEPSRFVSPGADRITYISNIAAIARSYGLTSPPDCASVFATPTSVDLTAVRKMNAQARLDPLLMHADATTESYAGFDPCGTPVMVEGTVLNPADSYYAYSIDSAAAAVSSALAKHAYTKTTVGAALVLSDAADDTIASRQYFSALDRVAILPGWVVTASASDPMASALDAYAGASPSSNKDSVDYQMLIALGDFDAVALLGANRADEESIQRAQALVSNEPPSVWSQLQLPDRVALAWKRTDNIDVLKFSLYYTNAADASASANEFANRLRSYKPLSADSPLCSSEDANAKASPSGAIVIATCTTTDAVNLHGLVAMNDVSRLLSNRAN